MKMFNTLARSHRVSPFAAAQRHLRAETRVRHWLNNDIVPPKMYVPSFLESINMLPYVAKGTL